MFALAASGQDDEARAQIRVSLQARQAALSTAVARLLVENNESRGADGRSASQEIYGASSGRSTGFSRRRWSRSC